MNKCVICNKEIKNDSQFVKGKWYHNDCIENLNNIINKLQLENREQRKELFDYKSRHKKAIEYVKTKKAIINTDYIRIFDLFKIDEQGYTDILLNLLQGGRKK